MSQTLSRIQYSDDPVSAATTSDLVVEAIVENMAVKKELFAKLDQSAPRYMIYVWSVGGYVPCITLQLTVCTHNVYASTCIPILIVTYPTPQVGGIPVISITAIVHLVI